MLVNPPNHGVVAEPSASASASNCALKHKQHHLKPQAAEVKCSAYLEMWCCGLRAKSD